MTSHRGRLIVHRNEDRAILRVMKRLFDKRFPIRRMELIDRYGADDHRSMNADNTSAFNCRFVAGTSRWSMHAYGARSTSTRSRTPTSRARTSRRPPASPTSTAPATPRA